MLAAALFVAGACDAITDVAQNAHGLRVQRNYGRSIINSFHAVWAVGAILGGLMGAAAIALRISRTTHLAIAAVFFGAVVVIAYPYLLKGADHERPSVAARHWRIRRGRGRVCARCSRWWSSRSQEPPSRMPEVPGRHCICGTLSAHRGLSRHSVTSPWSVSCSSAGWSATGSSTGSANARSCGPVGSSLRREWVCALAFPTVPGTIAGFAAAGLRRGDADSGGDASGPTSCRACDPGVDLTALTWLMRMGFFGAPLIVGVVADATSLRVGLLAVPIAGLVAMALAGALSARRRPSRS